MSKFKRGDVVKVTGTHFPFQDEFIGQTGIVLDDDDILDVQMDLDRSIQCFDEDHLIFIDKKKIRGFAVVSHYKDSQVILPTRKTKYSAGYDISILEGATIEPGETHIFNTGIKAYMQNDEYLTLHVRSSIGIKRGLILANVTGVIDADYYDNPDNEGHIIIALTNISNKTQEIKSGECVAQGIFQKYFVSTDDEATEERRGGIGSTDGEREKI